MLNFVDTIGQMDAWGCILQGLGVVGVASCSTCSIDFCFALANAFPLFIPIVKRVVCFTAFLVMF
jgi:hypothetical protein